MSLLWIAALTLAQDRAAQNRVGTVLQTVSWRTDWDEVRREAAQGNKPIFWLHVVGDLGGST